jgi:hypothetical protein
VVSEPLPNAADSALLHNSVLRFIDFIALVLTHFFELPGFLLHLLDLPLELNNLYVGFSIANSGAGSSGRCLLCFE